MLPESSEAGHEGKNTLSLFDSASDTQKYTLGPPNKDAAIIGLTVLDGTNVQQSSWPSNLNVIYW